MAIRSPLQIRDAHRRIQVNSMTIRPYEPSDFDAMRDWLPDARAHAMWCANRFAHPLEQDNFEAVLRENAARSGDAPFVAVADDGRVCGFFCYALNPDTRVGLLKFVVVDPARRGIGLGRAMLKLALEHAFNDTGARSVRLNVFPENLPALRCYEALGFTVERIDPGAFRFGDEAWSRCGMRRYPEAADR